MRKSIILIGLALGASAHGSVYHVESAFPTDQAGNAITPSLGQPFWMTVNYRTDRSTTGAMVVSAPWLRLASASFAVGYGAYRATYGPIKPLFDGSFPVQVSIGDATTTVTVTPRSADSAIEYYDPMSWQASFRSNLTFRAGSKPSVTWLVPRPESFGFQQVNVAYSLPSYAISNNVYQQSNPDQSGLDFWATSSAVRINANRLRAASFSDLKKIPSDVKPYTKSEALIESGDKNVKNLVASTLPKKFDKTMTVYDAAQALFQATVARLTYVDNPGRQPSAASALRYGNGDCGFFASVFVASCRQAGIPARPITGFLEGQNEWHVWAEFYVPNAGWVPVDPTFADTLDPNGDTPLYFGVIPDLNRRVATSIGFDHTVKKYKAPILQSPMAFTTASKVSSISTTCRLTPASNN